MRALILLITALILSVAPVLADTLLIVQSSRNAVANEALRGFRAACTVDSQVLVLSDYAEVDLARVVREEQPDLILAVGEAALKAARKIRGVPVVGVLSLSLSADRRNPANMTGVDVRIAPANYMNVFKALGLKRVGVVHNPEKSGPYIDAAVKAAGPAGIELVLRTASDPQEAVRHLAGLKGKVDGLWLIPDSSVVSSLTLEAFSNFSLAQKEPVVSFIREHLRQGAAASLVLDWGQMGRQAGELARRLLNDETPRNVPAQSPRSFSLMSNKNVLAKMGISLQALDKLFPKPRE